MKLFSDVSESGTIEIKRVYYEGTQRKDFSILSGTTGLMKTINMIEGFGFGNNSPLYHLH